MGVVAKPESNCLPVLADSSLSGSKQYNHLHTTFLIMLFHSSLISFVITIALASGITAFVNPVQRDSSCQPGTGVVQCCGAVNSFGSLPSSVQSTVTSADPNGDYSQTAGQNCSPSGPDCGGDSCCSNSNAVYVSDSSNPFLFNVVPGCDVDAVNFS